MTIDYYNQNANAFVESTLNVDMQALYSPFCSRLQEGALILDGGCGSGRDSKAFIAMGYTVEAMDASLEMVKHASTYTGIHVEHKTFQEIDETEKYDGIWTCASLLHVARKELPTVIKKLTRSLKNGGTWYLSFKYGNTERSKGGRDFTDMDETTVAQLLNPFKELKVVELWHTEDARPSRDEKWLNLIVQKIECGVRAHTRSDTVDCTA
ncbi:SAM-dependent methyltransferase [Neiella marina]|uniref:SAM-dependent methyltransferase n=1 Tax=Neiella marina TaxID=508461 RepID=A0A8J2XL85_9GAMM|nr:class I SAM-dependent methyltransferase [Neiella marina]GGA67227.1 SAM-dependent methyltransferase [Neiella marina]